METTTAKLNDLKTNIQQVLIGNNKTIDYIITALVAQGHVLLEDVPGTGKTVMAKTLAKSIEGKFSRIQFTPDLLPSDITGINYYNQKLSDFIFEAGPAFTNILLADEINRATPRTQSSLLECMEEGQITVDGKTHILPPPFFVIATQNPIETAGTFPLPEAQMDRFLMKLSMNNNGLEEEIALIQRFLVSNPALDLSSVLNLEEILALQSAAKEVFVHPDLIHYVGKMILATRQDKNVLMGVSSRGTLAFVRAIKAFALLNGRNWVVPEDIKELAIPVLAHRIIFPAGIQSRDQSKALLENILASLELPTEDWRA